MYKQLLIIGTFEFNKEIIKELDYLILPNIELTNNYQGIYNNEIIDFDYLIVTSKISKRIMSEDGYIITNNNFETSVENYFAIGDKVRSDKSINEQLKISFPFFSINI